MAWLCVPWTIVPVLGTTQGQRRDNEQAQNIVEQPCRLALVDHKDRKPLDTTGNPLAHSTIASSSLPISHTPLPIPTHTHQQQAAKMFHHRAGKLKQANKKHKARRHLASKRAVKREEGGKVNLGGGNASVASSSTSTHRTGNKQKTTEKDLKQDRLNRARQAKEQKRQDLFLQRRIGSADGPPRVVALLPLSAFCDTAAVRDALLKTREPQQAAGEDVVMPTPRMATASFKSLKQRFTFLVPRFGLQEALEAVRVADLVVFVLDVSRGAEGAVAQEGDLALSALRAQGLPTTVGIVQGLEHHHGCKSQVELRRYGHRFFETEFGDKVKVAESSNIAQLLRVLSTPTGPSLHWRQTRSYVVGEEVAWTPAGAEEGGREDTKMGAREEGGVLRVRGYVRGKSLNVDQLVHLPGVGTYAMSRILKAGVAEPCPLRGARSSSSSSSMEQGEEGREVLAEAVGGAGREEALKMWAEVDELAGEQTWPTMEEEREGGGAWSDEEEEGEEEGEEEEKQTKKKLLKKMSEYQASWFEGDEDEKEGAGEGGEEGEDEDEEEEDDDGSTDMDMSAADQQQQQRRKVKQLEEDELEFPDEVQTPDDRPAKERFARYRALKSFRTSPWDPYESLPREYARIFKFSNFAASHARVMSEMEEVERAQNQKLLSALLPPPTPKQKEGGEDGGMEVEEEQEKAAQEENSLLKGVVAAGTYVTLEIVGVSAAAWAQIQQQQKLQQCPLNVFSLLRYENKVSVLHFNIQKHPSFTAPLKSKERLLFYTGFRSFEARPVFSEHNLNCDKHKFSRYLHGGRFAVATAFGPVSMPPCPVLIFRTSAPAVEEEGGKEGGSVSFGGVLPPPTSPSLTLVATGTLHTIDPDRIILKRILLTGYPVRVKRRTAVVKHMFYNPEDVKWFKPAELSTKLGAAGHIKEPIGTHGLMKMRFNRIISQSDTICLPLFKRVFPKLLPGQQEDEEAEGGGGEKGSKQKK